jgi:hypothetical protein
MSPSPKPAPDALKLFVQCLKKVPAPRSQQGPIPSSPPILAIVLLGLLANVSTLAEIEQWTKRHFKKLSKFLRFGKWKGKTKAPCHNTLKRLLQKLSLADRQNAFAEFLNTLFSDTFIVAAVDGKSAKQMKDKNGDPILMLNVFAHTLKVPLASWSVKGDKTHEPACLKNISKNFSPCIRA